MIVFKTRFLTNAEIGILNKEVLNFSHLIYVAPWIWKKQPVETAEVDGRLAGVLVVYRFDNWIKLGPMAILKKYQGRGLGKCLLRKALSKSKERNIFINSTNPLVEKIALSHGFKEINGFLLLPNKIRIFLVKQAFDYITLKNFLEIMRKMLGMPRGKRKYFIKYSS